MRANTR